MEVYRYLNVFLKRSLLKKLVQTKSVDWPHYFWRDCCKTVGCSHCMVIRKDAGNCTSLVPCTSQNFIKVLKLKSIERSIAFSVAYLKEKRCSSPLLSFIGGATSEQRGTANSFSIFGTSITFNIDKRKNVCNNVQMIITSHKEYSKKAQICRLKLIFQSFPQYISFFKTVSYTAIVASIVLQCYIFLTVQQSWFHKCCYYVFSAWKAV